MKKLVEVKELTEQDIVYKIYEIRGKEVMLDSDLALLYHVETKRINEAVKNNPGKFPERYSWVLSDEEYMNLRSQFATANNKSITMKRYNPRVFTEQGVAMLTFMIELMELKMLIKH